MNSMLDVSEKGSNILVQNSTFKNMRICGSIVKPSMRKKYYELGEAPFLTDEQKLFIQTAQALQYKIIEQ